jgi:hypothetical protein
MPQPHHDMPQDLIGVLNFAHIQSMGEEGVGKQRQRYNDNLETLNSLRLDRSPEYYGVRQFAHFKMRNASAEDIEHLANSLSPRTWFGVMLWEMLYNREIRKTTPKQDGDITRYSSMAAILEVRVTSANDIRISREKANTILDMLYMKSLEGAAMVAITEEGREKVAALTIFPILYRKLSADKKKGEFVTFKSAFEFMTERLARVENDGAPPQSAEPGPPSRTRATSDQTSAPQPLLLAERQPPKPKPLSPRKQPRPPTSPRATSAGQDSSGSFVKNLAMEPYPILNIAGSQDIAGSQEAELQPPKPEPLSPRKQPRPPATPRIPSSAEDRLLQALEMQRPRRYSDVTPPSRSRPVKAQKDEEKTPHPPLYPRIRGNNMPGEGGRMP